MGAQKSLRGVLYQGRPSPRNMYLPSRQISREAAGASPGTFWRPRNLGVRTSGVITSGTLHPPPPMGASTPAASLPLSASALGTSSRLPEKGRKPRGPDAPSTPLRFPGSSGKLRPQTLSGKGALGPFPSSGKQLPGPQVGRGEEMVKFQVVGAAAET